MGYRLYLFGTWKIQPVPENNDGARRIVEPLVFGPGWYPVRVCYRPYPFGDRHNPYGLIEREGRWGGFTLNFWRMFQHDAHGKIENGNLRVLLEETAD